MAGRRDKELATREEPLVPESTVQLYLRMAKAFHSPAPTDSVAIAALSRVVELHHRCASMIAVAIEHSDAGGVEQLQALSAEQTRLAQAVGELVTELGGSPPRSDECALELPRDGHAMSFAQDQAQLMGFVSEDLDHVDAAHGGLAAVPEIPVAMHERLAARGPTERVRVPPRQT